MNRWYVDVYVRRRCLATWDDGLHRRNSHGPVRIPVTQLSVCGAAPQLFDQHGQLRTNGELLGERSMLLLVHPGPVDEKDPAMRRYARILEALGGSRQNGS